MGNVVCRKCGMEASSKCPYCRSVFPENQIDAMLSVVIKHSVEIVHYEDRCPYPKRERLKIWLDIHDDETEEDAWARLYYYLKNIIEPYQPGDEKYSDHVKFPSLKEFCCHHGWVFKPGQKSSIGCGH